ncbi:MAG: calcium-binding protein, partial [Methylococcaceae bacterium]
PAVAVIGGGTLSLSHLAALGINTWRIADAEPYNISGTEAADTVSVGAGSTTVQMGSGNDEIVINSKPKVTDNLDGGAGNDTLTLRGTDIDLSGATVTDIESIRVSSQSLSMTAAQWNSLGSLVTRATGATTGYILSVTTAGTTTLAADSAYMGLTGSTGDDRLIGNAADNILVGDNGNDELQGNAGNDRLVSGIGVDTLSGGEGNDTLDVTGKPWVRDQLAGGAGLDTLVVSDGQDLTAATLSDLEVLSGVGTVTLSAAQLEGFRSINGLSVQLAGTSSSFTLGSNTRLTNNARILLPTVDTTLTATAGILGSRGDDTLAGNAGNDMLYGGRGLDSLDGGSGDDTLFGGSGVDTLVGGAGNDRFEVQASEFTDSYQTQTMHSDRIDGGEGEDTLAIGFGGFRDDVYAIEPGSISNIENLVITGSYYSYLSLSADQWNRLTGFSTPNSYIYNYYIYSPDVAVYITINGSGGDLDLDAIRADSQISSINLTGSYARIDASHFSTDLTVNQLDSILLSPGNDTLRITGDQAYSVDGGAGNDRIYVTGVNTLTATTIEGGSGNDTLDVSGTGFIDLTGLTLNNVESLYYGSSTVLVTANQLATWSFDGAGAKYTKVGNTVVGTSGNDTYSGDGSG